MRLYGFKVRMLVTLSSYILNHIITPASVHGITVVEELLEGYRQSVILGYPSRKLQEYLHQLDHPIWTPLRENMSGAKEHNRWQLLTMRRTIETRFSVLCAFDRLLEV